MHAFPCLAAAPVVVRASPSWGPHVRAREAWTHVGHPTCPGELQDMRGKRATTSLSQSAIYPFMNRIVNTMCMYTILHMNIRPLFLGHTHTRTRTDSGDQAQRASLCPWGPSTGPIRSQFLSSLAPYVSVSMSFSVWRPSDSASHLGSFPALLPTLGHQYWLDRGSRILKHEIN